MVSNKIVREGYVIARYKSAKDYFTTSSSYDRPEWLRLDEATVFLSADAAIDAAKKLWRSGSITAKVVPLKEIDSLELEIPSSRDEAPADDETEMVAAKQDAEAGEETQGICPKCECDPCECDDTESVELSTTDHEEVPGEEPPLEEPTGMQDEESLVGQHLQAAAGTESEEETARLQPSEVGMVRRKRVGKMHPADMANLMNKGKVNGVTEGTDMSDRVTKSGGTWYVDREDVDSGKTVAKPGQTIKFTKAGKQYTAKVTDEAVGRDDDCYKLTIVDIKTLNEAEFKMPKRPGNDPATPEENDATVPNLKAPYDSKKIEFKDPLITADDDDTKLSHADAEEHADKVTVPAEIKSQLKTVITDLEQAAKDTNMRDDTKGSFAMTAAAALQQLLDDLDLGTVAGVKQAQIHMTSYMNPITSYIPADVTKFIAYGGRKSSLKSYFDIKWDNVRGVK